MTPATPARWLDSAGDIVAGDTIEFSEAVWGGSRTCPRSLGDRSIIARVLRESYGRESGQHTFTLEVLAAGGFDPPSKGARLLRKGRVLHRRHVRRLLWADETARAVALAEKHARGYAARATRAINRDIGRMETSPDF